MQLRTTVKMLHVVCQEMRYLDSERPISRRSGVYLMLTSTQMNLVLELMIFFYSLPHKHHLLNLVVLILPFTSQYLAQEELIEAI